MHLSQSGNCTLSRELTITVSQWMSKRRTKARHEIFDVAVACHDMQEGEEKVCCECVVRISSEADAFAWLCYKMETHSSSNVMLCFCLLRRTNRRGGK